jgi:3-methyladenine DNA glycosylase AlkC
MADLLKDNYNKIYVQKISTEVLKYYKAFKSKLFEADVINSRWEKRELKDRMHHVTQCLHTHLPSTYSKAVEILMKVAPHFGGFEGMLFPNFIEHYGFEKKNWNLSLKSLKELTKYSSSEFAIRPFINSDPKRVMKMLLICSKDKNYHVRRLSSEGCRPRLPWAMALQDLKSDPSLILPILENMKNDPRDYVYRSVANNLNDISKDNPRIVIKICKKWYGITENTDWVVKHALRTLLKSGNPKALEIIGYSNPKNVELLNLKVQKKVEISKDLEFSFVIKNKKPGKLRIEYAIEYLKKNGKHNPKVFKVSEGEYEAGEFNLKSKQSFRQMSTRKHYKGIHYISIILNGIKHERIKFNLV